MSDDAKAALTFSPLNDPVADFTNKNMRNILVNGGFNIWKRGAGPFASPAIGVFHADKWLMDNSGAATFTVTKETTTIDSGLNSLKLDITVLGGATTCVIKQNVENFEEYRGKILTVTVRVHSVVAGAKLQMSEGFTNFASANHTGSGWETLTVTGLINASASILTLFIGYIGNLVVSTVYVDSAMMVIGDQAILFVPEDSTLEASRCERHYQIGGDGSTKYISIWALGISDGTNYVLGHAQRFHIPMASVPTVTVTVATVYEEGSVVDQKESYTPALLGVNVDGFNFAVTKAIAGNKPSTLIYSWTAVG